MLVTWQSKPSEYARIHLVLVHWDYASTVEKKTQEDAQAECQIRQIEFKTSKSTSA
jgi:hypothetical protein